jgi:uncharacterized repeat protein (TIGR03803 family)
LAGGSEGDLYGTTNGGGVAGKGVVFKLDTTGTETVLHSFTDGADGGAPWAGVIRDSAGDLYGTTTGGGPSDYGVVFKLNTTGTETVLHSFTGGADGGSPLAGLIRDSAGNLYGTAQAGGASVLGVVFKLDTTGTETVLHSFTGGADGATPFARLIRDSAGNLYGTTQYGGGGSSGNNCYYGGCGAVFKLDTTGTETVLYGFTGGADGENPYPGLIRDSAGNLYGTTLSGGASGLGVVFKLDTTGVEMVLYSFEGRADGESPFAGLIQDSAGNLYGTTYGGGAFSSTCRGGCGVVFKLEP